jgi:hypothetical protein
LLQRLALHLLRGRKILKITALVFQRSQHFVTI